VFDDVKRAVVNQVTGMTGLDIAGVNLRIEDILTADEIRERKSRRGELPAEESATDAAADEAAETPEA
jgi:uncharacterized alkaline shock family protein YloU